MAVQSWKNRGESRIRILSLEHGYHGDTFGAMAVGARGLFSLAFEELMFDVEHLGTEGLDDDVARCETLCAQGDVAAFIFEPRVQGAEGMRMYPLTVLDRYMEICRRHGVVCIADEVMTGFGRAGPLFVSSDLRVTPDIVCLSKGLTSGTLPLAMTLCGEKLFESFRSHDFGKTFFHGHTFTANPIACAAALASVRLAAGGECTERRDRIARAHSRCGRELERYAGISNVRQAGTILAFDVRVDETSGYASTVREETNEFFLERGILLRPLGNVVYFLPPYCITEQELGRVHDALLEFAAARSR
jgi:adenosylmethionine-8-amino-7-oxononanoate aminotransferase